MTLTNRNTLSKSERLYKNKQIEQLFSSGEAFIAYPLRIVFCKRERNEEQPDVSIMVSVSKKKFKRAVKRNRIKRLVKEAYRLNKTPFYTICNRYNIGLDIAFLYLKNELSEYVEIEKAVLKTAALLETKLSETNNHE